jgi:hypothetical protein
MAGKREKDAQVDAKKLVLPPPCGRGRIILITRYWQPVQRSQGLSGQSSAHDPENSRYQWETCTVLWETGAQIPLTTHHYAKEAGFKGHPASIQISGVGSGNKKN